MANNQVAQDFYDLYEQHLATQKDAQRVKHSLSELRTAIVRLVLPSLKLTQVPQARKLTQTQIQTAMSIFDDLSSEQLLAARGTLQQHRHLFPQKSYATYSAAFNRFCDFIERQLAIAAGEFNYECAPVMAPRYGDAEKFHLTERRGKYTEYKLRLAEMSPQLRAEYDELKAFLSDPHYLQRVGPAYEVTTTENYLKDAQLLLGWYHRAHAPELPLVELRLSHLVPLLTLDDLEELSLNARRRREREVRNQMRQLFGEHRQFLVNEQRVNSPRTLSSRLRSWEAIAKFLYRYEVEHADEYKDMAVFRALRQLQDEIGEQEKQWTNERRMVSDLTRKLPPVEGDETCLEVFRREVVEPLRLSTAPRYKEGRMKQPQHIALHLWDYLVAEVVAYVAPRRQQEYRSLKLALSCPINRPNSVPADGYYFPLPPDSIRQVDAEGTVDDNWLSHVYELNGQAYPEGIWVYEAAGFKTRKTSGVFQSIWPDLEFGDGTRFYTYLERYVFGRWLPYQTQKSQPYGWWEQSFHGKRGRWVTAGRSDLNPVDSCAVDNKTGVRWSFGLFFLNPKSGLSIRSSSFSRRFGRIVFRYLAVKPSLHTMRYLWASWGISKGLSDAQMKSLAYAMGHRLQTLYRYYERCHPTDKMREIQAVVAQELAISEPMLPPVSEEDEALLEEMSVLVAQLSEAGREVLRRRMAA